MKTLLLALCFVATRLSAGAIIEVTGSGSFNYDSLDGVTRFNFFGSNGSQFVSVTLNVNQCCGVATGGFSFFSPTITEGITIDGVSIINGTQGKAWSFRLGDSGFATISQSGQVLATEQIRGYINITSETVNGLMHS